MYYALTLNVEDHDGYREKFTGRSLITVISKMFELLQDMGTHEKHSAWLLDAGIRMATDLQKQTISRPDSGYLVSHAAVTMDGSGFVAQLVIDALECPWEKADATATN